MIRTFWFVTSHCFKNRMVLRLRKLRSPRYAVSMLAGFAYLWFVLLRRYSASGGHVNVSALPPSDMAVDILSLIAFAAMLLVWAIPDSGGGLTFTESEIQFLFPAPVSRRELLIYKIFRQQPALFVSATMMTLFGFRHAKFVGLWLAFVAMSIYFTLVSLARARLKLAGIGFLARLGIVIAIAVAAATFIANDIRNPFAGAHVQTNADVEALLTAAGSIFRHPWIQALLFIPRLFAHAVFPKSLTILAFACASLLVLGIVFFEISARLNVAFEEASIEASKKHDVARTSLLQRRIGSRIIFRRAKLPFHLSERSGPVVSIAWKNVTAALRTSFAWLVLIVVCFAAFATQAALNRGSNIHMGVTALSLMLCAFFPFMASNLLRQDLRLDLPRMELLKTYPIRGDRLVLAEIAGPVLILTVVEMFLLSGTAVLTQLSGDNGRVASWVSPQFVVIALLFVIPICAIQVLIHNAVAILLPGWAVMAPDESRGFNVLGQRLVLLGGNIAALFVALIPAALVFVPTFILAQRHMQSSAFYLALGTVPAIAVLFGELWLAIHFLGAQFDTIDVTNEVGALT